MGRHQSRAVLVLLTALLTGLGALLPARAAAATVHVPPTPLAGTSVNGVVRAVVIGNGVAYVGGEFTSATGTNGTYARTRVAAFDLNTGAVITSFRADTNGVVRALAVNGSSLYIGGEFSRVNSVSRGNLAEVNAATGAVVTGFVNNTGGAVLGMSVGGGRLYIGGWFSGVAGIAQRRIAAISLSSRSFVADFRPDVNGTVHSVAASPSGDRVFIGGDFTTVGGASRRHLAALTTTGAQAGPNFGIGQNEPVYALDTDETGSRVFAGVAGLANRMATYNASTGARLWYQTAMGDIQAVAYYGGNVFFGFHEGFGGDTSVRMLVADAATGRLESAFRPTVNSWFGVRALDANAQAVLAGGEFTRVNGLNVGRVAIFRAGAAPPPPPPPPPPSSDTYVVSGATWRILDGGATAPSNWAAAAFDDSGWRTGRTEMGYGDGDEATVLSFGGNANSKPITYYTRTTFHAGASISDVTSLALRAVVDDGAVVYLNGQEIWRFNLPSGPITSTTRASTYIAGAGESTWRTASLPAGALRPGTNVVAVEVHQDAPSSSDLSLNLELRPNR